MFKEIGVEELESRIKVFSMYHKDWSLITAGDEKGINTMTASWGGLGVLWNRNVATVYVRPSRHTRSFIESQDLFTVSFFGQRYREELDLLGSKSGRDCDKIGEVGFTPVFLENAPTFEQAELMLVCRKIYRQQLNLNNMLDHEIVEQNYSSGNVHIMFLGEIRKVFVKK